MFDIEFIIRLVFLVIGIIWLFKKYQEIHFKVIKIKWIVLYSLFCSILIDICFLLFFDNIFYLGSTIFFLLTLFLYLLNPSKLIQTIYFNTIFVVLVFYVYLFVNLYNRTNYINTMSFSFSKFVLSLYTCIIFLCIIINSFNIQFALPDEKINIFILIVSISLLFLELLFINYLCKFRINNVYNVIIYLILGIIFFSYNIIIQYLYNDYHQLTMISQNNFISKITDSYINGIQKEQEKVYKIKHDIKNNLIILQHLINNGKIEDANKILQEISQNLEYKKSDIYTGNIFIDAYLTNIINTSKIDIQMKCSDLKEMHYKPDVLSIIINLVDNAVENASRRVDLYIKYENKNNIMIKVSNDCENDPTKLLKKSKKKGEHGYGLRIVKDIVNKYEGTYLTSYENHIFTTYVVINVEDKNEK